MAMTTDEITFGPLDYNKLRARLGTYLLLFPFIGDWFSFPFLSFYIFQHTPFFYSPTASGTPSVMSLKAELETWAAALKAYDEEDFDKSLELFSVRRRLVHPTILLMLLAGSALQIHPRY